MIKVENLTIKLHKKFYDIYNLNIEIKTGDIVSITSDITDCSHLIFTNAIAGMNRKCKKNITIQKDIKISYCAHNAEFLWRKNIFYNLEYPLKIRKIEKQKRKIIIDDLIEKYNIDFKNKKAKQLTNDQLEILSLLRCSTRVLDVIIIDYPDKFDNAENKHLYEKILNDLIDKTKTAIIAHNNENLLSFDFNKKYSFDNGILKKDNVDN